MIEPSHAQRTDRKGPSSDRSFGVTLGTVGIAIGLFPLLRGGAPRLAFLFCGLLLAGLGFAAPAILHRPNRAWNAFAKLLSRVTNPVFLTAAFLVIVTPVGLLRRLITRDPLRLRWQKTATTYWLDRDASRRIDFRRQF